MHRKQDSTANEILLGQQIMRVWCVCVCMQVHAPVHLLVCGEARGWWQLSSSISVHFSSEPLFLPEPRAYWLSQSSWPASPKDWSAFAAVPPPPLRSRITGGWQNAQHGNVGGGDPSSALMLCSKPLTAGTISPAPDDFVYFKISSMRATGFTTFFQS